MNRNCILVRIAGRNGNLMFEICGAYYRYIMDKYKKIFYFFHIPKDLQHLYQDVEAIEILNKGLKQTYDYIVIDDYNTSVKYKNICKETTGGIQDNYEDNEMVYFPIKKNAENLLIEGCRQSPKYWDNNRDFAINLFKPKKELIDTIHKYYSDYDFENLISINIRRGDYLCLTETFGLCEEDYYNKCIEYFGKDKKYLVVSDDIEWCKTVFIGDNFYFVDKKIQEFDKSLIDMFSITLCRHNIIGNSTFSWWAAYLNIHKDRTVLYPMPWYVNFRNIKNYSSKDFIPENDGWIAINKKNDDIE